MGKNVLQTILWDREVVTIVCLEERKKRSGFKGLNKVCERCVEPTACTVAQGGIPDSSQPVLVLKMMYSLKYLTESHYWEALE